MAQWQQVFQYLFRLCTAQASWLWSQFQALALEVKFNIKVSSIEFGDMKTEFTENRQIVKAAVEDEKTKEFIQMF